ncbi:hypothetical protein Tco_0613562, partial [Tanacetum coccineum]
DDNDLHDERQDQSKEEEVEPRRCKRARTEKSFGPDFLSFMVENEPTSYREAAAKSAKALDGICYTVHRSETCFGLQDYSDLFLGTDNLSDDRAYILGQSKNVVLYRILTCGTTEEVIYKTQEKKQCFQKTNFELSVSVRQLLQKQKRNWKPNSILHQHVEHLNSFPNIAGILNHSIIFSKPAPRNDMFQDNLQTSRRSWYDEMFKDSETSEV